MRSAVPRALTALVSLLIPILVLGTALPARGAQDSALEARLILSSIPVAHAAGDPLGVKLRISNTGDREIDGFRLTVGAGDIIRSRSALHESFEGVPVSSFSFTLDYPRQKIPPGGHVRISVDTPVEDLTGFVTEGGVRPLSFSVFSTEDTFTPLDSLTTQMLVYPSPPEEPLNLVPVVPLNYVPARAPDGAFAGSEEEPNWLETEVLEDGWVSALVRGLEAASAPPPPARQPENSRGEGGNRDRRSPEPEAPPEPLHVGFAPTPRLLEELGAMADGYVRSRDGEETDVPDDAPEAMSAQEVLGDLREIVGRDGIQPLLVPYSNPDLPTIEEELAPGDVGLQLTEGITVLQEVLDLRVDRTWVFPPGARLDAGALQALQTAGVTEGVFFGPDSLEGSGDPLNFGCPVPELSFVCPVRVTTDVGDPLNGYVTDADLQKRLTEMSEPGSGRIEAQRVLAETAMIHAEQPGLPGRVLTLVIPTVWHPDAAEARLFFEALRDAPWLRSATPAEGLERSEPPDARRTVDDLAPTAGTPDELYFDAIGSTQDLIESFSSFLGEREARGVLQRLRRNLLVAEGRSFWDNGQIDVAASYVEETRAEADGEMSKVTLGVPEQTTFTSRTGSLDIALFNQTEYPVEARVVLRALDMEFEPSVIDDTFAPQTHRLSVRAEAQTSGTFPIQVSVETADGYVIATQSVQVRSTEFNVVALAITFGAVAFLFLFYTVKVMRKRRRAAERAEASAN